jgi:hypothetical protein
VTGIVLESVVTQDARGNAKRQAAEFGVEVGDYQGVVWLPRPRLLGALFQRPKLRDGTGSPCRLISRQRGTQDRTGRALVGCTARRMRGFFARRRQRRSEPGRRFLWRAEYKTSGASTRRGVGSEERGHPGSEGSTGPESIAERKLRGRQLTHSGTGRLVPVSMSFWQCETSAQDLKRTA